MKNMYERIDELLKKRNMTKKQLAQAASIPYSTLISAFNRSSETMSFDYVKRMATALEISVNELLNVEEQKGVMQMTIKDKLNLMDEIKAANESRVKAFLQESKTVKHWKADYAVICTGARMNELRRTVRSKEQRICDIDALLAADKTIHDLQPVYDEYSAIRWKGAKEHFATSHADELEQYKKAQRLLHKFSLAHPIDRKPLRAEKVQLEQEVEALRPDVEAAQAELDKLKTVRYWVRKVIPDALPSRTESGAPSLRSTIEESQNANELENLLERTAKQAIAPQQDEVHRESQRQRHETL